VDFDGNGNLDLALLLQSGGVVLWEGNGRGELIPREAAHAGHQGHGLHVEALEPGEQRALRELLQGERQQSEVRLADLAGLPSGFIPRFVVSGRFSSSMGEDLAVIGSGTRPRVLVLAKDGSTVSEVVSPSTVHTVFVGEGGFAFSPDTLSIQPGDTVHWVWSSLGHNVVSGSSCVNDNLFCSPSNTNCGANPTSSTGATYDRVFPTPGSFPYFCRPHCPFGMTGTITVGGAAAGVLEATSLQIAQLSPSQTQFTYAPACGATSHAIYFGVGPIVGAPNWRQSLCADASGTHVADLANPVGLQYFVVVGQDASAEGSYGKNSQGLERPEAVEVGECDLPQVVSTVCP
jgi:plastocyanin